VCEDDVMISVL